MRLGFQLPSHAIVDKKFHNFVQSAYLLKFKLYCIFLKFIYLSYCKPYVVWPTNFLKYVASFFRLKLKEKSLLIFGGHTLIPLLLTSLGDTNHYCLTLLKSIFHLLFCSDLKDPPKLVYAL